MISGEVDDGLEPTVILEIAKPGSRGRKVPFVVDTGYNGRVSLPPVLIQSLGLTWHRTSLASLADGSEVEYRIFRAEIVWDEAIFSIDEDEADTVPLLGTELLRGYEVAMQMRPHGKVTIEKLPPKRPTRKRT